MAGEVRIVDNVDIPFVDDQNVIGTWNTVDFIKDAALFNPSLKIWASDFYVKRLQFAANGALLCSINTDSLLPIALTWTNGHVLNAVESTDSAYMISNIGGIDYLFLQWKSGDYSYRGLNPYYYVFKREETP